MKNYDKPSQAELKQRLTPMQYDVTQNDATEPPHRNEFWNNEEDGLYVDVVSGEPLFSSREKFNSSCGWASFDKPLEPENFVEENRQQIRHAPHRSALQTRRFASGPRFR